jgi:hypothetical protein
MLARVKQELLMRLPQLPTHGRSFDELRSRPDNGNYLHLNPNFYRVARWNDCPVEFPGNSGTQDLFGY